MRERKAEKSLLTLACHSRLLLLLQPLQPTLEQRRWSRDAGAETETERERLMPFHNRKPSSSSGPTAAAAAAATAVVSADVLGKCMSAKDMGRKSEGESESEC